jgi:hypothetical protein
MEKEFVPYELAVKLKELGFDEPCLKSYGDDGLLNQNDHSLYLSAPLYQQAFRWFREKYNMDFTIITNYAKIDSKTIKSYRVGIVLVEGKKINSFFLRPKKDSFEFLEFKTYEEAELACLDKLIELVESELK